MSMKWAVGGALSVLALGVSSMHAQQGLVVRGAIVDASGAPVAGAVVELDGPAGEVQAQAVSAANGGFVLEKVAAGTYVLLVPAANGFAEQRRPLQVTGSVAGLKVVLIPGTVEQTVDVGDVEPVSTEATANKDSVAVSAASLEHLPVFDQNIVAALTRFLDPSATASSGVSIVVDGMEMKGVNVSASAIAEARINSDPYSAEFASAGRGRLEITTKPGKREFHGELNVIARDAVFNARNYFAPERPAEQRRIFEGHLVGPVGRGGHTTFLLSGSRKEQDLQTAVHAVGPSGLIEENAATPSRSSEISGRVTHDFSAGHRLAATYNFRYTVDTNQFVGGIVLPEAGVNVANRQEQIVLNDRVIVSPHLVQQAQLLLERETESQGSVTAGQSIQVQGAFVGGGGQTDVWRTEHTVGIIDVVSWTHGKHYVRFGVNIPQISRRAVDDHSNRQGTYSFNSLSDYQAARPYRFTLQQGPGRALYFATEVATFAQDEIALRPNLHVTLGARYQWQTYFTAGGNVAPRASLAYMPAKKWVLRAGSGIFYDRTGGDLPVTFKLHNGTILRQYQVLNPGYPNPLAAGQDFSALPTGLVREQAGLRAPYQVQYSVTAERQLGAGLTATATYRGITGVSTFRSRDANAPLAPYTGVRPDPTLGVVQQVEAAGRTRLNAVDLGLRGKLGTWFEGQAQYTYGHANNNTGGINWFPQDQYQPNAEWGRADTDRRHRFNVLGSVRPDHWLSLGVAAVLYSGAPYTELAGVDRFGTGLGNARPAGVPRNGLEGTGTASLDLLWDHDIHLTHAKGDKAKILNFGVSGFNVLNHANFTNYVGNVRSTLYQQPTTALAGRQMQFSTRFQF